MAYLLHIESATRTCSVALSDDDKVLALREDHTEGYSHANLLTTFMEEVTKDVGIGFHDLQAVSVSMGPGSYTGLRIGVSAAKGLCYGLDIPLIAVDTLESMAHHCRNVLSNRTDLISPEALEAIYCPMIDARRMEVYTCLFNCKLNRLNDIEATIIQADSLSEYLDDHKVFIFGDGASKCKPVISRVNAVFFDNISTSAAGSAEPANQKFQNQDFVDLAYFEPFYLKDFVAGKSRVKGL